MAVLDSPPTFPPTLRSLRVPAAVAYLETCVEACSKSSVKLRVLARNPADSDEANFAALVDAVRGGAGSGGGGAGSSLKLGHLAKEAPQGAFIAAWRAKLHGSGVPLVDCSAGVDNALASKTIAELVRAEMWFCSKACSFCVSCEAVCVL